MLKRIAIGLVILIAAILGYAATKPETVVPVAQLPGFPGGGLAG